MKYDFAYAETPVLGIPKPDLSRSALIREFDGRQESEKLESSVLGICPVAGQVRVSVATLLEEMAVEVRKGVDVNTLFRRIDQLTDLVDTLENLNDLRARRRQP